MQLISEMVTESTDNRCPGKEIKVKFGADAQVHCDQLNGFSAKTHVAGEA